MINFYKYLFNLLDIKISINEIKKECNYYENKPLLFNISDSLFKWNIKNMMVRLTPSHIHKIPIPAIISKINTDGGFDILKEYKDDNLFIFDSKTKKIITIKLN